MYHLLYREYKPLQSDLFFVFDNDDDFINFAEEELIFEGFDCTRDVFIECGVTGLEHRRVVFLAADKKVWRIDLPYIQNGMDGDFN